MLTILEAYDLTSVFPFIFDVRIFFVNVFLFRDLDHSETPDLTFEFSRISIETRSTFRLDTLDCL